MYKQEITTPQIIEQMTYVRGQLDLLSQLVGKTQPNENVLIALEISNLIAKMATWRSELIQKGRASGILVKMKHSDTIELPHQYYDTTIEFATQYHINRTQYKNVVTIPSGTVCVVMATQVSDCSVKYKLAVPNPWTKRLSRGATVVVNYDQVSFKLTEEEKAPYKEAVTDFVLNRYDNLEVMEKLSSL